MEPRPHPSVSSGYERGVREWWVGRGSGQRSGQRAVDAERRKAGSASLTNAAVQTVNTAAAVPGIPVAPPRIRWAESAIWKDGVHVVMVASQPASPAGCPTASTGHRRWRRTTEEPVDDREVHQLAAKIVREAVTMLKHSRPQRCRISVRTRTPRPWSPSPTTDTYRPPRSTPAAPSTTCKRAAGPGVGASGPNPSAAAASACSRGFPRSTSPRKAPDHDRIPAHPHRRGRRPRRPRRRHARCHGDRGGGCRRHRRSSPSARSFSS